MLLILLIIYMGKAYANLTTVDLTKCKVTHIGSEYIGRLSITEFNNTCQYWSSNTEKGAKQLEDILFPDGSKNLARNYCRNPTRTPNGPWCFTRNKNLVKDTCLIPLCKIKNCRLTGPGMEYAGSISKSASGRKCKKWRRTHELEKKKKETSFKNNLFPDGSQYDAENNCRNPNGNVSGPWCYIEKEKSKLQEIEFCDIPFCDDTDPIMYSSGGNDGRYFFFTNFNETETLKLGFRLWDEGDWLGGKVFILLSNIDTFGNRSDFRRWQPSVEIMISNSGSGIISSAESEMQSNRHVLSSLKWTTLEIVWATVGETTILIQVFEDGNKKPFLASEIDLKEKISTETPFQYFSLSGSSALWNIYAEEEECHIHTSSLMEFTRYYLMRKNTLGINVDITVRAIRQAVLLFRVAPMMEIHQVQIIIGDGEKVKVAYYGEDKVYTVIGESKWPKILNLWKWEEFKIHFLNDKLQIHWQKSTGPELIMNVTHPRLAGLMWIAFGSPYVSYWAIYCDPRGTADPPPAAPPECLSDDNDDFNGTLRVTHFGRQCVPWMDDVAVPMKYQNPDLFDKYGGKIASRNFCRNLDRDGDGPFCMVKNSVTGHFEKENCHPRSCNLGECKLAGTANDYIGHLNRTRSKRDCLNWTDFLNDSTVDINNFPDATLEDAANFCRNPSKTAGGSWCFTSDPLVQRDFCYVKDCDKSLECTIISSGFKPGHFVYVMPYWRKHGLNFWLKAWNPDIYEGLKIRLVGLNEGSAYELLIGDENNEKLKFFYVDPDGNGALLVQKTLLHLIPAGKWGGFWLRPNEGRIELGYHGMDKPFFEWSDKERSMSFDPIFMDFGTIQGHWIGINFHCTECLLERTTSGVSNRIYPINLWSTEPKESTPSSLVLFLRGTATLAIILMNNPDFDDYMSVRLSTNGEKVSLWEFKWNYNEIKLVEYDSASSFSPHYWTEYEITFQEKIVSLKQDNTTVFSWEGRHIMLFYWFSIQVLDGYVIWTANCPPADIDGPPRNGNWGAWGPWSCSVSCGGGQGRTQRECNSPPPNVFGRECKGRAVYDGPCNTFPCGEISPGTNDIIRYHLSSQYQSLTAEVGAKVILSCNDQARNLIIKEIKKMNITWTLNGFPFSQRRARINSDYSLVIPRATEHDNGVYLCIARQDPLTVPSKVVLEVVSLIVNRTTPMKRIRKGRSFSLKCNGLALSYVYGDLSQRWEVNGKVWKDYGITVLETVDTDKVENVTDSHDGIWICIINQPDLGFTWKTNWIHIQVGSAVSFWTHLTEDSATAPLFGRLGSETMVKIAFFALIFALLAVTVIPVVLLIRHLKRKKID